jgi:hypothetical protein
MRNRCVVSLQDTIEARRRHYSRCSHSFAPQAARSRMTDGGDFDSILSQISHQHSDYEFQNFLGATHLEAGENLSSFEFPPLEKSRPIQELNPNANYFQPKGISISHEWVPAGLHPHSGISGHRNTVHDTDSSPYEHSLSINSQFDAYPDPWGVPQFPASHYIPPKAHQIHYHPNQPVAQPPARPILPKPSLSDLKRETELELTVSYCARIVLYESSSKCLKSVELANSLRDRLGKDSLQRTKTLYGGLLVLLELFPQFFFVHRIPKNDMVELIDHTPPYSSFPHPPKPRSMDPIYRSNHSLAPPMTYQGLLLAQSFHQELPRQTSRPEERIREIKPSASFVAPARPTDHFIIISDVPETITGGDLWKEFGGNGVVQKVSLDYQGNKRTGIIYFISDEAAMSSFQLHSEGKWKGRLVRHCGKKQERHDLDLKPSAQPPTSTAPNTETRMVTSRAEQLPHFYQDVLRELCNFTFVQGDKWKRNVLPDYLFCQLLTEMLKPQSGAPIPILQLKQQLVDAFGRPIHLHPFKAFLIAYSEYFDLDEGINLVRASCPDLPAPSHIESIF